MATRLYIPVFEPISMILLEKKHNLIHNLIDSFSQPLFIPFQNTLFYK